jgi:hypothetical protein
VMFRFTKRGLEITPMIFRIAVGPPQDWRVRHVAE